MKSLIRNVAVLAGIVALAGCSTLGGSNPKNTSRAQFMDRVWVSPSFKGQTLSDTYMNVYFAPVSTGYLKRQDWWSSQSIKNQAQLEKDAAQLGAFMRGAMIDAARNYPNAKLQVVPQPGPVTLVVETAIVGLVPSKAFWNAAATAAGFVAPGAGLLTAVGRGEIQIEGRLRDGMTGEVLATFQKTYKDQFAVVNLSQYTWYGGSEINIKDFAQQGVQFLNAPARTIVKRKIPINLVAF